MMAAESTDRHEVEELAEDFTRRLRAGEVPEIGEYARRHPRLAQDIERLFPAIRWMERCRARAAAEQPETVPSLPLARAPVPPRLGDFELIREIGRGGMGVVYEAEQSTLGRRVALKVIAGHAGSHPAFRERFHREAAAAARLHHTNIVPVYGVGESEGLCYYAMQFIAGHSLAARPAVKCGPEFFRLVTQIGIQAAEALTYAHQNGVLHRDVKPSNLLLDAQGTVWLTDFGLAKGGDEDTLTETGEFVGTLRYLAPERVKGVVDARSDLFGLGLTLYELLAGRPAYDATDRSALLQQVVQASPPRLRKLRPDIPRELETIVQKAIAAEPAQRYPTGADLADDLRRFAQDLPIRARRTGVMERAVRSARRNPRVAALSAALFLALALIAGGATLSALRLHEAQQQTSQQLSRAEAAETKLSVSLGEKSEALFRSLLGEARSGRLAHQAGQRHQGLAALTAAAGVARDLGLPAERLLELRSEAIACLALPDVRQSREWEGYPSGIDGILHFDPRREHYSRLERKGALSVRAIADDRELARLPAGWVNEFSPDGRYVIDLTGPPLRIWDWRSETSVLSIPSQLRQPLAAVHPAGGRLAACVEPDRVAIFRLPSGVLAGTISAAAPTCLAFDPAFDRLAVGTGNGIEIHDLARGEMVRRLAVPGSAHDISWSPDGRLISGGIGPDVYVWETATGRIRHCLSGHQLAVLKTVFSSDGGLLLSTSYDETGRIWDPWTGRLLLVSPCAADHAGWDRAGLFRHGGTRAAAWEFTAPDVYTQLAIRASGSEHPIGEGAISPDERWLALPEGDGVALCATGSGRLLGRLKTGFTQMALFHPRGDWLLTSGRSGLWQWPVAILQDCVRIGPPRRVLSFTQAERLALDDSGRTLAVVVPVPRKTIAIIELEPAPRIRASVEHTNAYNVSLSPDGELLATGTWNGFGVKVWDSRSGELVRELLPDARVARVRFSGDGRRLLTAAEGEFAFWDSQDWRKLRTIPSPGRTKIPGYVDSTQDGSIVLAQTSATELTLLNRDDQPLAVLPAPYSESYWGAAISPRGTLVLVTTRYPAEARLWRLDRIREELSRLGLDWTGPAPHAPRDRPEEALSLEIDSGEFPPWTP